MELFEREVFQSIISMLLSYSISRLSRGSVKISCLIDSDCTVYSGCNDFADLMVPKVIAEGRHDALLA
ncbi:MAG: hypothetical protein AAE977_04580 [Thermoplasmataceae archaeon]